MLKNLFKAGRNMYLLGIAELAVYSFFKGDLAMSRPGLLPQVLQGINPTMTYIAAALMLLAIVAFYSRIFNDGPMMVVANLIFWLVTVRHILHFGNDHVNGLKSLWLVGGALLALTLSPAYYRYRNMIGWINLILLCMFFIDCGIAHFRYPDFVAGLIPPFIPFPVFFSNFAGFCLIAGGAGLLIPPFTRWVALLSGIQITGWFLLLHIPRAITIGADEWIGVGESLAISGICFMLYSLFNKSRPQSTK